ncbi:MAG: thioredoxin family protein [Planctomycetia bacterium]
MFSTCTAIPLPSQIEPQIEPQIKSQIESQIGPRIRTSRLLAGAALLAASIMCSASAAAAVPWHPDLSAARRASEASQRPVLAIFTASWSSSSATLDRTTFASDEAVALIRACFEPVCVDVDTNPDATRRLGVTKVPTACILSSQEQVLSRFELPETPAGFVAAAARAVQEAAVAAAARHHQDVAEVSAARRPFADVPDAGGHGLPPFGGEGRNPLREADTGEIRGTVPPGGQAINAVAAKVRMLSEFAGNTAPADGAHDAIASSFREIPSRENTVAAPTTTAAVPHAATAATPVVPALPPTTADTVPTAEPVVAPTPATTPLTSGLAASAPAPVAEPAASPLAGTVAQKPLSIEPSPAPPTQANGRSAPWLGLPQREQVPAAAPPALAAAPPAGRAQAAPQEPQEQSAKPATVDRSSALADTKPAKPAASASSSLLAAIQKPFTMFGKPTDKKPAEPKGEAAKAVASNAAAAEPDPYGSMPVGLEGYCPVTLAERGAWVEGRAQWGVRHRGRTYLFASAEQQRAFLADPDRYTPMLSGDDPVLAVDAGKSTPGQRRYGVTYQSRTYLFSSPETRDAFAANPQRYTSGALVAENRGPSADNVVR